MRRHHLQGQRRKLLKFALLNGFVFCLLPTLWPSLKKVNNFVAVLGQCKRPTKVRHTSLSPAVIGRGKRIRRRGGKEKRRVNFFLEDKSCKMKHKSENKKKLYRSTRTSKILPCRTTNWKRFNPMAAVELEFFDALDLK